MDNPNIVKLVEHTAGGQNLISIAWDALFARVLLAKCERLYIFEAIAETFKEKEPAKDYLTSQIAIFHGIDDKILVRIAAKNRHALCCVGKFGNEGMNALSQVLHNSSIIHLSIYVDKVENESLKALLVNSTITNLDLVVKELENAGMKALSQGLENSQVISLRVIGSYGDQGVKDICQVLEKSKITDLRLLGGPYGDEGVQEVLSFISSGNSNLHSLVLVAGKISRHTFGNMFKALKHDQKLKEIWFPESNDNLQTLPSEWLEDCFSENSTLLYVNTSNLTNPLQWYTKRNTVCKRLEVGKLVRNSIPHNTSDLEMEKFVKELKKRSQPLRSMKLVVLGNGQIGKTTLLRAMHNILDSMLPQMVLALIPNLLNSKQLDQNHIQINSTVGIDQMVFKIAKGDISVWDFAGQMEYTATHSFFLSLEMTSILVCFNLGVPVKEQKEQITFWLDFLNSSLSLPPLSSSIVPKWNIILVGVREDEQSDFSLTQKDNLIASWHCIWNRLPISSKLFTVSSLKSIKSVHHLLKYIEQYCTKILDNHATLIPVLYHNFLLDLESMAKQHLLILWSDLFDKLKDKLKVDEFCFKAMLKYAETIGRIVWLPNGFVFTDPVSAPKIAAKFISPKEVRERLLKDETYKVQILNEAQVGSLLMVEDLSYEKLSREIDLIVHLKICFPLRTTDSNSNLYLFPSLSNKAEQFRFLQLKTVAGVRLVPPRDDLIFVSGFFCQFLVTVFTELNIYKDDIQTVCVNGAIIHCPGMFDGELIVMIEPSNKSIVITMNAPEPDTGFITNCFNHLIQKNFSQYTGNRQETLCPECIKLAFLESSLAVSQIGALRSEFSECSTQKHPPPPPTPTYLQQGEKCKTHAKQFHDIFLNYRVKCEGTRSISSYVEPAGGVVEQLYCALAKEKTKQGKPIYVFWDQKCLNDGKNWEMGFEHGVRNSRVIVLLMSDSAMEGIVSNAARYQDNVLLEYETALLLSRFFDARVFPVFLAEIKQGNKGRALKSFSFNHPFPDVPHKRDPSSQLFLDKISHAIPEDEKRFLTSIKQTMSEIFKLQGAMMPNRTENEEEMKDLVRRILALVESSPPVHSRQRIPSFTP